MFQKCIPKCEGLENRVSQNQWGKKTESNPSYGYRVFTLNTSKCALTVCAWGAFSHNNVYYQT